MKLTPEQKKEILTPDLEKMRLKDPKVIKLEKILYESICFKSKFNKTA